jgi:hypothetical protein
VEEQQGEESCSCQQRPRPSSFAQALPETQPQHHHHHLLLLLLLKHVVSTPLAAAAAAAPPAAAGVPQTLLLHLAGCLHQQHQHPALLPQL